MKRISTLIFIFLFVSLFVNAKSYYGLKASYGENFYFVNDEIKTPFYSVGIECSNEGLPFTFFEIGYIWGIQKSVNTIHTEEINKSFGLKGSLGYNFVFYPNEENFISITPCLTANFLDFEQNEYTSTSMIQAGVKCIFGIGTNITSHLRIKFSVSPQYNFVNYIYEYKEKSEEFYVYNEEDSVYETTTFTFAKSSKTFTSKSFCYDLGFSVIYTF